LVTAAAPAVAFGLIAAGLLAFPVVAGLDGHGRPNLGALLATLPLSLSMGAAEWSLFWYRGRTQRSLRACRRMRRFAWRARGALAVAVIQYLAVAALLIAAAAVIADHLGLLRPQWTMVPTLIAYVLLGGSMFIALLLQTFRLRAVPLVA